MANPAGSSHNIIDYQCHAIDDDVIIRKLHNRMCYKKKYYWLLLSANYWILDETEENHEYNRIERLIAGVYIE
jgi:hypothetical protein